MKHARKDYGQTPKTIQDLADGVGGKVAFCAELPDGSGAAVMSMPLPKDHWIYERHASGNIPPMPLRVGAEENITIEGFPPLTRRDLENMLRSAGQYAIRCATMNGRETDFDPDALIQQLIVGMLGYHTPTGFSRDPEANPK